MNVSRTAALFLVVLGTTIGLIACLRVAAVLQGVPRSLWLVELPVISPSGLTISERVRRNAAWLSETFRDTQLVPGLLAACNGADGATSMEVGAVFDRRKSCDEIVDYGLSASPTSSELWLIKAQISLSSGRIGDNVFVPLRKSYRTGAREGWIAGLRVVSAMRIYQLLPEDLRRGALDDLKLVLEDEQLMRPLVIAYTTESDVRPIVLQLLRDVPLKSQERFLAAVRNEVRRPAE